MKETLSASKIKTLKACSWQYWCKYHLKLPDKTNSGALKGEIVHLVLECLGRDRHRKHYDLIIKKKKVFASKAVKRLISKHVKNKNLKALEKDCVDDIVEMTYKGLLYDFFGKKHGAPTESLSEKDFELAIEDGDIRYKVKGFIDKLFIYGEHGFVIIRDFKTNKKMYEGKEVSDNLQDYIYTLAIKKLYPHLKDVKMEFVFLKQDIEKDGVMTMQAKTENELTGFELELTEYQKYADCFTEKTATSNMAANQGMPKDGSFSGKLLCGFASKPNEMKKDGSPKWSCTYKFPFNYYAILDKDGNVKKCVFNKSEIDAANLPFDYKIEERHYAGCPAFNRVAAEKTSKYTISTDDDFF